jgi:hypothetical protein
MGTPKRSPSPSLLKVELVRELVLVPLSVESERLLWGAGRLTAKLKNAPRRTGPSSTSCARRQTVEATLSNISYIAGKSKGIRMKSKPRDIDVQGDDAYLTLTLLELLSKLRRVRVDRSSASIPSPSTPRWNRTSSHAAARHLPQGDTTHPSWVLAYTLHVLCRCMTGG